MQKKTVHIQRELNDIAMELSNHTGAVTSEMGHGAAAQEVRLYLASICGRLLEASSRLDRMAKLEPYHYSSFEDMYNAELGDAPFQWKRLCASSRARHVANYWRGRSTGHLPRAHIEHDDWLSVLFMLGWHHAKWDIDAPAHLSNPVPDPEPERPLEERLNTADTPEDAQ